MSARAQQKTICFTSDFALPGFQGHQPAGDYKIEYVQESIEGITSIRWRTVNAFIFLPRISENSSRRQMLPIDTASLQAIINKHSDTHA